MDNIYDKEKKLLKATKTSQVDEVLESCDEHEKDTLIRMLVARMNGGMIRE